MNLLVRKLIDLYEGLMRRYYSWRYGPVARRLGTTEGDESRGFIVIQIDGLSHATLLEAVARGYAPHIGQLLRSGQGEAYRWFSGVPSTTPAVQAAIMYGSSEGIVGFRWYEKESGQAIVCKFPGTLSQIQARVSAGRRGILEGGASYANMFDGGASTSLFTLSAIGRTSILRKMGGLSLFLVLAFSPVRVMRILALSVWTYLLGVWRRLSALFWPSKYGQLSFLSPFVHVLTDVVVREIETFAVLVDIYRGVPAIYANYSSYDEWAHRFGPTDGHALRAVKAIDSQVQQVDRMRRRWGGRPYDLYLLSDHGMTPSVPFETAFGQSLGQFVDSCIEAPTRTDEARAGAVGLRGASSLLGYEVGVAEDDLEGLPSDAARSLRLSLERRAEEEITELPGRTDVVVRDSGPLSHVYFSVVPEGPMDLSALEEVYPGLVRRVADHPGIAVVGVRTAVGPQLVTAEGTYPCRPGQGEAAFADLADATAIVTSLRDLLAHPSAGDLVLLGRWNWWGRPDLVVTFERQRATHGGVGGEQCYPFIIGVTREPVDLSDVRGPTDIYRLLLSYRVREMWPESVDATEVTAGLDA
ncbi:MAG: hypothetical protein HPY83_06270 [Anaerolineae bacterium]|nr:hypothetical protein [Anaerolineae bacterium]